jgi:hypothetical protein
MHKLLKVPPPGPPSQPLLVAYYLLYNNCVVAKLGTASTGKSINL